MEVIKNLADAELLEAIRRPDKLDLAIRSVYRDHFDSLSWLVKNNSGSQQDAEDIFQEVVISFIELVQKDKFRGESSVKTFLYSLTKHTWLNELKKRGRSDARELKYEKARTQEDMDVNHLINEREVKQQVMDVVGQLGDSCKKILVMFYYENLSMREIVEQTKYENEQVVRNKKYKCLKQLEQMVHANPAVAETLKNLVHG